MSWSLAQSLAGWLLEGLTTAIGRDPVEGPTPGCGGSGWPWVVAGDLGQWVVAAAVITLGIRGLNRPGSRQSAAIACWLASRSPSDGLP